MPLPVSGIVEHGHGHEPEAMQCRMTMLWNTSTSGICVVFASWEVSDTSSFLATLLSVFLLAMLLEYLQLRTRSLNAHFASSQLLSNSSVSASVSPSHRRKASVQQTHHPDEVHSVASPLSPGVHSTLEERSSLPTISIPSSWDAGDDDSPLLPGVHVTRPRRLSIFTQLWRAVV